MTRRQIKTYPFSVAWPIAACMGIAMVLQNVLPPAKELKTVLLYHPIEMSQVTCKPDDDCVAKMDALRNKIISWEQGIDAADSWSAEGDE